MSEPTQRRYNARTEARGWCAQVRTTLKTCRGSTAGCTRIKIAAFYFSAQCSSLCRSRHFCKRRDFAPRAPLLLVVRRASSSMTFTGASPSATRSFTTCSISSSVRTYRPLFAGRPRGRGRGSRKGSTLSASPISNLPSLLNLVRTASDGCFLPALKVASALRTSSVSAQRRSKRGHAIEAIRRPSPRMFAARRSSQFREFFDFRAMKPLSLDSCHDTAFVIPAPRCNFPAYRTQIPCSCWKAGNQ